MADQVRRRQPLLTVNRDDRHIMEVFHRPYLEQSACLLQMLRGAFTLWNSPAPSTNALYTCRLFNQRLLTSPEQPWLNAYDHATPTHSTTHSAKSTATAAIDSNTPTAGSFVTAKKCPECGGPTERLPVVIGAYVVGVDAESLYGNEQNPITILTPDGEAR